MKLIRHIVLLLFIICSSETFAQLNHKHYITKGRIDLSEEDYSEAIQFSFLPEYAVVKCNADKTKYVISITHEEAPITYYIEKN